MTTATTKLEAAKAILGATGYYDMRGALSLWDQFMRSPIPPVSAFEHEVAQVNECYTILRSHVFEWYAMHLITALEARIDALENPYTGRLGPKPGGVPYLP